MAEKKAGGIVHFVREWEQKRMLLRMLEVLDDVRLLKQLLEFVENKLTFLQRKQSWLQLRHRSGLAEIQAEADFLKQMREALKGRISPMENNATAKLLGLKLRQWREAKAITMQDLAERSYFTFEDLQAIEDAAYPAMDSLDLEHLMELLEVDSLDLFEMVMALEDEYSVEIPAEDLQNLLTVGDVMKYLKDKGVE